MNLEYQFSNIHERGNVYRYDIVKHRVDRITSYPVSEMFFPPEVISLGGIEALLYKPIGFKDHKEYPLVVQIGNAHEPPSAQWSGLELGFHFNEIVLLKPCIRGKMGSGAENLYGVTGSCGVSDVADLVRFAESARKLDFVHQDQLFLLGSSFGGFVALRTVQEYRDLFRGLVLIGAVYDLEEFAAARMESWDQLPYSFYFGRLDSVNSILSARNPMREVHKIKIPILMFHGPNDPRVSERQAREFARRCTRYEVQFELRSDLANSP